MTALVDVSQHKIQKYGWLPDLPDFNDYLAGPEMQAASVPSAFDNCDGPMPSVWDQSQIGSCTAHGTGVQAPWVLGVGDAFMPSRLSLYWFTRYIEGTTGQDAGAQVRDAFKALNKFGVGPESDWAYDITKFTVEPPQKERTDGLKDRALAYKRVAKTNIKAVVAAKNLVTFGFTCYESFESPEVAKTGILPMPEKGEGVVGGHCVCIVGYDDARSAFKVRNSWGKEWGLGGYFWMPYTYVSHRGLASDFWTCTKIGA